jgi:hypothetical protein
VFQPGHILSASLIWKLKPYWSRFTVMDGDTAVIQGTVTSEGGIASVNYVVAECRGASSNTRQLRHAENLADASGRPVEEIIAIREGQCRGWGEITMDPGLSPDVLGIRSPEVR